MKKPARYFRAGVGAVIADKRGRVLALERSDIRGAWQFPQGGLEKGERPIEAAFREIKEETGLSEQALTLITRYPELLAYEIPRKAQSKRTGMGQVQYWFLFLLNRRTPVRRRRAKKETRAARWVTFDRVVAGAVSFKRPMYRRLRSYFRRFLSGKA